MVTHERIPPQSMEGEQATLGAMLLEREAVIRANEVLVPADFYRESHQLIFTACITLLNQHQPVDLITLGNLLKERNQLEFVGGTLYLTTIMAQVPTAAGIIHYAWIVKEKALRRNLITQFDKLQEQCYTADSDVDEIAASAGKEIDAVLQVKSPIEEVNTLGWWMGQAFVKLEEEVEKGSPSGIMTGLGKFDEITGGFKPGEVTLIGALPNVGKSHFVLNNIAVPAARAGYKVLFLSVEMHPRSIAQRALVCLASQTKNYHLKLTGLRNSNWFGANSFAAGIEVPIGKDLATTVEEMWDLPFLLHQPKGLTPGKLLQYGRKQKRETGLDLIVVDYVQRMCADAPTNDLRRDMISISRALHEAAERLELPIIAVSSLNRAGAQRSNKRPVKSDLAESSALEYDADLVAYIHRPSEYDESLDYRDNELIIAKQRNGPLGIIPIRFNDEKNVFIEVQG